MKKARIYCGSILVLLCIVELFMLITNQESIIKMITAITFIALAAFGGLFLILWEWKKEEKKSQNQLHG